jgi:hypothetical protein
VRPDADCVRSLLTGRVKSRLSASGSSLDLIGRGGEAGSSTSGRGMLAAEERASGHSGAASGHDRLGPVIT